MTLRYSLLIGSIFLLIIFCTACGLETEESRVQSPTKGTPTAPAPTTIASLVEETDDAPEVVETPPIVEVIDSNEAIIGTWRFQSNKFNQYLEDGTWYYATSQEILESRIESGEWYGDYWFEDGFHHVTSAHCVEQGFPDAGVYEIQNGEDDRANFVLVEDSCWTRMRWLTKSSGRMLTGDE